MEFHSLREFIDVAREMGEVQEIDGADWNLEIGAISELMAERKGPVLLFDHIKDYPAGYRVLTNAFNSVRRTALVHDLPTELTPIQTLNAWREKIRDYNKDSFPKP